VFVDPGKCSFQVLNKDLLLVKLMKDLRSLIVGIRVRGGALGPLQIRDCGGRSGDPGRWFGTLVDVLLVSGQGLVECLIKGLLPCSCAFHFGDRASGHGFAALTKWAGQYSHFGFLVPPGGGQLTEVICRYQFAIDFCPALVDHPGEELCCNHESCQRGRVGESCKELFCELVGINGCHAANGDFLCFSDTAYSCCVLSFPVIFTVNSSSSLSIRSIKSSASSLAAGTALNFSGAEF